MVSSGTVNGDASSVSSQLSSYSSAMSELNGSWQGSSYDSISSQSSSFVSEYQGAITSQMSAFAKAVDLYTKYKTAKQNVEIAKSNYNTAFTKSDTQALAQSARDISTYQKQCADLKFQIEAALREASSTKLHASSLG